MHINLIVRLRRISLKFTIALVSFDRFMPIGNLAILFFHSRARELHFRRYDSYSFGQLNDCIFSNSGKVEDWPYFDLFCFVLSKRVFDDGIVFELFVEGPFFVSYNWIIFASRSSYGLLYWQPLFVLESGFLRVGLWRPSSPFLNFIVFSVEGALTRSYRFRRRN